MKNKLISLIAIFALLIASTGLTPIYADQSEPNGVLYSDIAGDPAEGAVNTLSALGVINGYEDGTFKPADPVTRAEMTVLITKMLSGAPYATATNTDFQDCVNVGWAIPYIEYCAQLGIVKGYDSYTFGPTDNITYEQAVTMIIRALGYTDDCNEMIGTYPSAQVQKAIELGILTNISNTSEYATRGDIAIMLYNALDLPFVYIDHNGTTQYRSGAERFTLNGNTIYGISVLSSLNKDGAYEYKILSASDLDIAEPDLSNYLGTLGKVYTDKEDNILAFGDIQTVVITGYFNDKYDKFTTADTTYSINDNSFKGLEQSADSRLIDTPAIPLYLNGAYEGDILTLADAAQYNRPISLSVKINGSTITSLVAVLIWDETRTEQITESDIANIDKNAKLFGKSLQRDDYYDIDIRTFNLIGIDSLAELEEDNMVTIYADTNDYIRRIEVGTDTISGRLDSFTEGNAAKDTNYGKPAQLTINGATYSTSTIAIPDYQTDQISEWLIDSDDLSVGDDITVYFDCYGAIIKATAEEYAVSSYSMVLDYDLKYSETGIVENSSALNGDNSVVSIMSPNGTATNYYFKNGAEIVNDNGELVPLIVGDIITFNVNSSNRIRKITVHTSNSDAFGDISKKGYYNGTAIADNAAIFIIDKFSERAEGDTYPPTYIDDNDVSITTLDRILNSDNVYAFSYYVKNNKIIAMSIDGDIVSNATYGFITSWTRVSADANNNYDYRITTLTPDGEETYYFDGDPIDLSKSFYQFKFNAAGAITDLIPPSSDLFEGAILLEYVPGEDGLVIKNDTLDGVTIDKDAHYYQWSEANNCYELAEKADLIGSTNTIILIDIEIDNEDPDGVADIVIEEVN